MTEEIMIEVPNFEATSDGWSGKEAEFQENFSWGIGPEALFIPDDTSEIQKNKKQNPTK